MNIYKKIFLWFAGITVVLTIFLLTLAILATQFIHVAYIKEKVITTLSKTLEGKIDLQKTELSFFPRPCIKIQQVRVSIQEKVEGSIKSLKIYPEILPLLIGEIHISKIQAESPDFSIWIPESKEKLSLIDIENKLSTLLHILEANASGLDIAIKKGRLNLYKNQSAKLLFQDINAKIGFPPSELKYSITVHSGNSDSIALSGRLDPGNFRGKGSIYVKNLKLHTFLNFLFPDNLKHVVDSIVNLRLTFQSEGIGVLQSEAEGFIPYLFLQNGNQRIIIKGRGIKAAFDINRERTKVSVNKLELYDPQITLSGLLQINNIFHYIDLSLEGKEINVDELRDAALALAGNVPIVRDISVYVTGGKVPLITFHTQGSSLDDLGKTENIVVKGHIIEGKISIRGPDLAFKTVKGDCIISKGILEGSQIQARLGNNQLSEGKLRVGLKGKDAPLHLDTLAKVDLAELMPILKHIVKNEPLLKEFNLISEVRGNAQGRLVLGEKIDSIQVGFDVSNTQLSARYKRIPYPVEVNEGSLSYDSLKIRAKNVSGTLGKSSFTKLNGTLQLGQPRDLEIASGKSYFVLEEIYPWISSYERLRSSLKNITSLQGTIIVTSMNVKGPLVNPEKWGFRMAGALQNLKINSPLFPGPLSLTSKNFEVTPQRISLSKALTNMLDASITLSGFFKTNLKGIQKAEVTLNGTAKSSAIKWGKEIMSLPSGFKVPYALSLSDSHLSWEETGNISFKGSMKIRDGPDVLLDIHKTLKGLSIKKLFVKDRSSNATLSFESQGKKVNLAFSGILTSKTVNTLITLPDFPGGSIKGNFQAEIQMEKNVRINAQGKLNGEKIVIPWESEGHIKIEKFFLDASSKGIKMETNSLTWADNSLSLRGNLNSNEKGAIFDMDVSADRLGWNSIKRILALNYGKDKKSDQAWKQAIHGIIRLRSKAVTFNRFTVSPFDADISLTGSAVDATITKADVCTIPVSGKLNIFRNNIKTNFKIASRNQTIEPVVTCIGNKDLMTGSFDLKSELSSHGKPDTLIQNLDGNLVFNAKDGRIYRYGIISKIFALVNVTEIFRGKLPDIAQEGFAYHSISLKGTVENGKLLIKEAIIDGSSMEIVFEGNIDLVGKKVNLNMLVAPLKTVDFVLRKIPLIRDITGRSLISMPVRVTGDLENPEVTYHPLTSVGSGLLGIMERTIELPVKIIQPLISNGDNNRKDTVNH
jgi:hypothetical protein